METNTPVNIWIRYLFPVFLGLFLGTLIFLMAQFREPPGFTWYALVWFITVIFLIWECGWWISKQLDQKYNWREGILKRLLIQLVVTNIFGVIVFTGSFILLNCYEVYIKGSNNFLGVLHIVVSVAEAFIIVQMINSVQIGYQIMNNWQGLRLEAEAYKKESAVIRLTQLQQQIDPSFLHNNLDHLQTLIKEFPDRVEIYLQQLSENYSNNQSKLVSILGSIQQTLQQTTEPLITEKKTLSTPEYKRRFLVKSGNRFLVIPISDIVLFYKDDIVLLYTKQGKKYPVDLSLEEINLNVDRLHFFRINRQFIIHDQYISDMKSEGNQLLINTIVPFPSSITVSQRNIPAFKRWLNS